jgi:hypothetical protein
MDQFIKKVAGKGWFADQRQPAMLHVRGKNKFRNLVAAGNVAEYLERIRTISRATEDEDFVSTNSNGKRAGSPGRRSIR